MKFCILSLVFVLAACSGKTYENKTFPDGEWKPINPIIPVDSIALPNYQSQQQK